MIEHNPKSGFTLIELLVVISIIVILITMGMTSFSTAQRKGRDAKRKADLREIKNALEQYYTICGLVYPTPAAEYYNPIICEFPVQEILVNMPVDPRSASPYVCRNSDPGNCTEDRFEVCAELEGESPNEYCVGSSQ